MQLNIKTGFTTKTHHKSKNDAILFVNTLRILETNDKQLPSGWPELSMCAWQFDCMFSYNKNARHFTSENY